MNTSPRLAFAVFFICFPFAARCQGSWKLLKDKDGIQVSSRTSASSAFNDVRVEVDLPGSPEDVVNAVFNVKGYQDWAYATKNSVPVSGRNDSSLVYYSEIVAPWPVSNRDLYARISVRRDSDGKKVAIVCSGLPHFGAIREHLVRIPFSRGSWTLTPLPGNRVHLDYILEINPGGSVPAWVMNMFIAKGPMESFSKLRTVLTERKKS